MKIKFTIEKSTESEKDGMFKKVDIDMYLLTATFTPSEIDKRIIINHPLSKRVLFMKYNELDKWTTGIIFKDKQSKDKEKVISVGEIFDSPTYAFRAYSIPRIIELRNLVIEAGESFSETINIMEKLEGSDEIDFATNSSK